MNSVSETLRQVWEGQDFDSPERLLRSVKPEQASALLPGWPYSIGTNVAHADHWNRIWLGRLQGMKRPPMFPDFPLVSPEDWLEVRQSFLTHLQQAQDIACAEPFVHKMRSDEMAAKLLLQIALHTSYHLGQVKLLKRLLRLQGSDSDDGKLRPGR